MFRVTIVFCLIANMWCCTDWRSNSMDKRWSRITDVRWGEYVDNRLVKIFDYVQHIPADARAVIIQQQGCYPLVLDKALVYYDGREAGTGGWSSSSNVEWNGRWFVDSKMGGAVRFLKDDDKNRWYEYDHIGYKKTFKHIQEIDTRSSALILQERNRWPLVLTDTAQYYEGNHEDVGGWTCK